MQLPLNGQVDAPRHQNKVIAQIPVWWIDFTYKDDLFMRGNFLTPPV